MAKEKQAPKRLSRKDFVKGAAAVAGVGALASCAPAATPTTAPGETAAPAPTCPPAAEAPKFWLPAKWDYETDVVVVGTGFAGLACAITAFDAGAKVLILEKVPSDEALGVTERPSGYTVSGGGGNSCICGGEFWMPDTVEGAAAYARAGSWGTTPMAVCQAFAEAAVKIKDWFEESGITGVDWTSKSWMGEPREPEFIGLPGNMKKFDGIFQTDPGKIGAAPSGHYQLDQAVQSRGIPYLYDSPATDLIQDPITKEILGVKANSGGTEISVKARRAVILCMGSFEYNERLKLEFLRSYPVHFYGWRYNTGDAIPMCEKVGAGIWHMNVMSGRFNLWQPEYDIAPGSISAKDGIHVDKYGKRFGSEKAPGHSYWMRSTDFNLYVPEYSRIPIFYIFDETEQAAGPIIARSSSKPIDPGSRQQMGGALLPPELGGFPWMSEDNSVEIEKGWIQKGSTIEELATAINEHEYVAYSDPEWTPYGEVAIPVEIDPAVLKETVTRWNGFAVAGEDLDFQRTGTLKPIETPPFYAIAAYPGGPNTQGGPIRNERGQVCDGDFNPIPRLYSNGECGSFWGMLYEGGGDLTECFAFGQISGKNAAAETPWE